MSRRISFMDRVSIASASSDGFGSTSSGGRRRSTFRPSLLGQAGKGSSSTRAFYNLDMEAFDSSLGCPLKSYENATLALVGGKALQCWRLTKHGYPVPTAFVIPTYVYSLHVGEAGVAGLIQEVFASGMHNKACRPANEAKLERIREAIMNTPLQTEVYENLRTFLDAMKDGTRVAVRSSGSAEDLASQSFAGQYDTFLYKKTLDEVVESVKACWARCVVVLSRRRSSLHWPVLTAHLFFTPLLPSTQHVQAAHLGLRVQRRLFEARGFVVRRPGHGERRDQGAADGGANHADGGGQKSRRVLHAEPVG